MVDPTTWTPPALNFAVPFFFALLAGYMGLGALYYQPKVFFSTVRWHATLKKSGVLRLLRAEGPADRATAIKATRAALRDWPRTVSEMGADMSSGGGRLWRAHMMVGAFCLAACATNHHIWWPLQKPLTHDSALNSWNLYMRPAGYVLLFAILSIAQASVSKARLEKRLLRRPGGPDDDIEVTDEERAAIGIGSHEDILHIVGVFWGGMAVGNEIGNLSDEFGQYRDSHAKAAAWFASTKALATWTTCSQLWRTAAIVQVISIALGILCFVLFMYQAGTKYGKYAKWRTYWLERAGPFYRYICACFVFIFLARFSRLRHCSAPCRVTGCLCVIWQPILVVVKGWFNFNWETPTFACSGNDSIGDAGVLFGAIHVIWLIGLLIFVVLPLLLKLARPQVSDAEAFGIFQEWQKTQAKWDKDVDKQLAALKKVRARMHELGELKQEQELQVIPRELSSV